MLRIVLVDRDIDLKSAIFNQFQPLRSRNRGSYTRIIHDFMTFCHRIANHLIDAV